MYPLPKEQKTSLLNLRLGLFITEALHPFEVFRAAGFEVDLVSETGTWHPDHLSTTSEWLPAADEKVYSDPKSEFRSKLDKLPKPSDLDASQYGLFFASAGHASLIDYPTAKGLHALALHIYAKNAGIMSAVCHGGAIFPGIRDPETGKSVISGKRVTGFTTQGEEEEGVLETIQKWDRPTIEKSAADAGATYVSPPGPWESFTVTDGRLVTGANPASARKTAEDAVKAFDKL